MLERLGRWLRVLGVDAEPVGADESDAALVLRARDEGRVLLTRDRRLAAESGPPPSALLVRSDAPLEQLREVTAYVALAPAGELFTRCLLCNLPLEPVDDAGDAASGAVGARSLRRCPRCGRVYWEGGHTRRMRAALAALGLAALSAGEGRRVDGRSA